MMTMQYDPEYNFKYCFNKKTGFYFRSGILDKNGKDTGVDPFQASFPHLIDIGIMGHCTHGITGFCKKSGVQCYQNGADISQKNMSVENFESILKQCTNKTQQIALGGRGDPNQHEDFPEILKLSDEYNIVPNYTTSGFVLSEEQIRYTKKYCGSVAVSWYRSKYSIDAIKHFLEAGCKTNIHYVLSKSTINEAIDILESDFYIKDINALIFLMHKPIGQGTLEECLDINDDRLQTFCKLIRKKRSFKIGFDSCSIPMLLNYGANINHIVMDTCEGGRFSCYISNNMIMTPCSFDRNEKYGVDLSKCSIKEAWDSEKFNAFRNILKNACLGCDKRELCMGGCPLTAKATLCSNHKE